MHRSFLAFVFFFVGFRPRTLSGMCRLGIVYFEGEMTELTAGRTCLRISFSQLTLCWFVCLQKKDICKTSSCRLLCMHATHAHTRPRTSSPFSTCACPAPSSFGARVEILSTLASAFCTNQGMAGLGVGQCFYVFVFLCPAKGCQPLIRA